jgi:hypothetical protein
VWEKLTDRRGRGFWELAGVFHRTEQLFQRDLDLVAVGLSLDKYPQRNHANLVLVDHLWA